MESLEKNELVENKGFEITKMLRYLGGVILITSAISFMVQRWYNLDSLLRFYSFLGFSVILALGGLFCATILKEEKGARTFLGISASFLPVHFMKLGALIYSLFADKIPNMPTAFIYKVPSVFTMVIVILASMTVLVPLTYFGVSSFARQEAKRVTAAFFMLNAFLLIPIRDAGLVSLLSIVMIALTMLIDRRTFQNKLSMKTWEGGALRVMLFVPSFLILTRSYIYYSVNTLPLGLILALVFIMFFEVFTSMTESDDRKITLESISLVPLAFSTYFILDGLFFAKAAICGTIFPIARYEVITLMLVYSAAVGLLSFRSKNQGKGFRIFASMVSLLGVVGNVFDNFGAISTLLCIIISVISLVMSAVESEDTLNMLAVVSLVIGIIGHIIYLVGAYHLSSWVILGALGIGIVICSSYLENKKRNRIKQN